MKILFRATKFYVKDLLFLLETVNKKGGGILYTIVMNKNKELVTTVKTTLYQREKLIDKIQFLIPEMYNKLSLSDFTVILKYVDQANVPHAEILRKDEELYKNKLRYTLPVDTNLTKFAGDVSIRLTFSKTDSETKTQYVMHTGETVISISPLSDYYHFVPDESLEFVDQLVGELNAKLEATDKIAETYDKRKADNLSLDDNVLQLVSNGEKIGDAVTISENYVEDGEFKVVEF